MDIMSICSKIEGQADIAKRFPFSQELQLQEPLLEDALCAGWTHLNKCYI